MSSNSDSDVNADLQALANALAVETARRAQAHEDATRSSTPLGPSDALSAPHGTIRTHDQIDDLGFPQSIGGFLSCPYTLEEGRALKRTKNLSSQSEADAEAFLKADHPAKHAFQAYLVSLENRDKLTLIWADHNEKYKLSSTLHKTCLDYAHVGLLSPNLKSYRDDGGSSIAADIIAVMRVLLVSELPPPRETGRCDVVKTLVQKGLTEWRCHMKACIFNALIDEDETLSEEKKEAQIVGKDIATLTRSCIGNAPMKATVGLYHRVAFIRTCAQEYKTKGTSKPAEDQKFWSKVVDYKLAQYHKIGPTKEAFRILMHLNYEKDVTKYGPPNHEIPITELKDIEDWLTTLHEGPSRGHLKDPIGRVFHPDRSQCRHLKDPQVFTPQPLPPKAHPPLNCPCDKLTQHSASLQIGGETIREGIGAAGVAAAAAAAAVEQMRPIDVKSDRTGGNGSGRASPKSMQRDREELEDMGHWLPASWRLSQEDAREGCWLGQCMAPLDSQPNVDLFSASTACDAVCFALSLRLQLPM
ncbi:hypothetical protein B0H11DRAFT_2232371 [Mycena galericulata]|nr:hypothetical protein B0H11DRAFT_2232371 [Mycena galericulata]